MLISTWGWTNLLLSLEQVPGTTLGKPQGRQEWNSEHRNLGKELANHFGEKEAGLKLKNCHIYNHLL